MSSCRAVVGTAYVTSVCTFVSKLPIRNLVPLGTLCKDVSNDVALTVLTYKIHEDAGYLL